LGNGVGGHFVRVFHGSTKWRRRVPHPTHTHNHVGWKFRQWELKLFNWCFPIDPSEKCWNYSHYSQLNWLIPSFWWW
jgi:hypothetical protein